MRNLSALKEFIHIIPEPELNQEFELTIVDLQVRIIISERGLNDSFIKLNLNHLSPGFYLLRIISDANNAYLQKFIKQ